NLDAIAERSARIDRMRAIVSALRPAVDEEIEQVFGHTLFLDRPTPARLIAWRRRAQTAAATRAGYSYAAYGHLKLSGVVQTITGLLYQVGGEPGQQRWRRIRAGIEAAIEERGFGGDAPSFSGKDSAATIDFLRTFDIGFRIRRLRLMARRLSEIEADGTDDASAIHEAIYASLASYLERQRADDHPQLRSLVRRFRGSDGGALLDALGQALDLTTLDAETDERLAEAFATLDRPTRRALLLAYLGFPYFDTATLPLLQGEGLDEFDPIKVDRIAPDDATSIRAGGAEATLKGIQFNSFGAFFSRAYRENDYLWGRLHGAERMIDICVSTLPANVRMKPGRVAAIKRAAFRAILDEEEPRLTAIPALIASLRTEIG
ncbi:MAG: DUF3376 domain-containing protein, partial [Sphingomonas sp.]